MWNFEFHYLYGFLMWNYAIYMVPCVEFHYLYGFLISNFIIYMDFLCGFTLSIWIPCVEFHY